MDAKNIIWHFFLTTRPYSYAGEIARGILFGLLLNPLAPEQQYTVLSSSALTLLMWVYFNWQSDWIQKDEGRLTPSYLLCFFPVFISVAICFAYEQLEGIIGIGIYIFFILLYSLKKKYEYLGLVSPILRILTVLGHFLMLTFFYKAMPSINTLIIVLFVALLKGISNLVGDLRDIKQDKYEIPARFGIYLTTLILRASFVFSITIAILIDDRITFYLSLLLTLLAWLFLEFEIRIHRNEYHISGYFGHIFLVQIISIYLIATANSFGLSDRLSIALIVLLVTTSRFYRFTPGKNYYNY